ncbi:NAD(P)-dependent oxidoreductase [Candidatus Pelagibacter sp.]|nr:NAD(P)-dependent oxidoreductase [Candidatus Pelagibacter sp.]
MKKICIMGGAGFIGHNLAIQLRNVGHEVICVDNLMVNNLISVIGNYDSLKFKSLNQKIINSRLDLLEKNDIELRIADARDYHLISKLVDSLKPDVIIHLAAVSHSNRSNKDPYNTFDHSFRTLENVLDASRGNLERLIFFSSSMVYGNFTKDKAEENDNCEPIGIYGTLKYCGEKIIKAYNQVFDTPYTIIRPSALYGERCISRRIGQIFIENAINGEEIKIGGDGEEKLDFTYIKDLCNGVQLCVEKKEAQNEIFNLTYGEAKTINNLKDILINHFPEAKITYEKRDKLMPKRGTLSIDKAKKLLGYNPSYSIDDAYPAYIKWYKDFINSKS